MMKLQPMRHLNFPIVGILFVLGCSNEVRMRLHADWAKNPKEYYDYGSFLLTQRPRNFYMDGDEGLAYIEKAASMGHREAMWRLGSLNASGFRPEEQQKAVYWYTKAAYSGDRVSMNELENANRFGLLGLPVNVAMAEEWHRRFLLQGVVEEIQRSEPVKQQALKGDLGAMKMMAHQYEEFGDRYWKFAVEWYEKAAEAGDTDSAMKLVQAYREGTLGLPRDEAKCNQWFRVWQWNMKQQSVGGKKGLTPAS